MYLNVKLLLLVLILFACISNAGEFTFGRESDFSSLPSDLRGFGMTRMDFNSRTTRSVYRSSKVNDCTKHLSAQELRCDSTARVLPLHHVFCQISKIANRKGGVMIANEVHCKKAETALMILHRRYKCSELYFEFDPDVLGVKRSYRGTGRQGVLTESDYLSIVADFKRLPSDCERSASFGKN